MKFFRLFFGEKYLNLLRITMYQKSIFVSGLTLGNRVDDVFMLAEASRGQAKNGPFWSLLLADSSGDIPAKIFSPQAGAVPELAAGMFLHVRGQVGIWRDQAQIVIEQATVLDPDEAKLILADFIQTSNIAPEELLLAIETLCKEHLHHPPLRTLVQSVLTDDGIRQGLLMAPGAVNIHHAYVGGLLEHTLAVCNLCMHFCDLYPGLDRQILLAAAILHDLGKAWEYCRAPLKGHTDSGRLLGHIQLGLSVLEPFVQKALKKGLEQELVHHLYHLILSHHGELEFGSPKRPKTAEAFALHFADNLDAKLKTTTEATEQALGDEESGWSARVFSLQRRVYRPVLTPNPKKNQKKHEANQCLLPLKG